MSAEDRAPAYAVRMVARIEARENERAVCREHAIVKRRHELGLATDGELRQSIDRCDMAAALVDAVCNPERVR